MEIPREILKHPKNVNKPKIGGCLSKFDITLYFIGVWEGQGMTQQQTSKVI